MLPIRAFGRSETGRRDHNEDAFLLDEEHGLFAVADGMGGHAAGEVASKQALEAVRKSILSDWPRLREISAGRSTLTGDELRAAMTAAFRSASAEVFRLGQEDLRKQGMGTTCVAALVAGGRVAIGHVGDSRAYLRRGGEVHQLTDDHNLFAELVRRGTMTAEDAARAPGKNILLRTIGLQPDTQVDTLIVDLQAGDALLLCTDGVHGELHAMEIHKHVSAPDPQAAAARLVESAIEGGGKDNATAVVVELGDANDSGDAKERSETLRRIPLFEKLDYKELLELVEISSTRRFDAGQTIVREGEPGEEMFALVSGRVQVTKADTPLIELRKGGYFGELILFDGAPRSATVVAAEDTTVVAIEREGLARLLQRDAGLAVKLLWTMGRVMASRLRNTSYSLSIGQQDP